MLTLAALMKGTARLRVLFGHAGETMFRVRRGLNGRLAVPTQEDLEKNSHAVGWYMQRYSDTTKQWQDQYFFTETVATQGDFEVLNWAVATDPRKGFYHVRPCHIILS